MIAKLQYLFGYSLLCLPVWVYLSPTQSHRGFATVFDEIFVNRDYFGPISQSDLINSRQNF